MLLCDTSGLVAFFNAGDRHHEAVVAAVEADPGPFVVSPFVLAELDHVVARHIGEPAELAVLGELSGGAWELASYSRSEVAAAREVIARFADHEIGLADASVVVLASRYKTDRVLTIDHRHFSVLRTSEGASLTLVPG